MTVTRIGDASEPRIAGVILAAGEGRRFGSRKQLARVGDRTMLEAVIRLAEAAGLDPVLAVVPPDLPVPAQAVAVPNPEPQLGLSRSVQLGIHAVPTDAVAAVILLGDQPTLEAATVQRLMGERDPRRPILAVRAGGHLAPPVLLERDAFGIVDDLAGDIGLRDWLAANPELVTPVDVPVHPPDIDTRDDLRRIGHMFDSADR